MGVGIRTSDLLVLLDVPANRRARAHRLPVETDLRVLHLDLPIVQRPALRGHTALTRAADLHRGDDHVGELVLHVGLLVPAGAAEREDGGGEVIAGGAGLAGLGRRLVEQLLDGERAHVAALPGEGARGGHGPRDGLRDAPAEREDLDLVLVLGVVGLALDSIDLQVNVGRHGTDPFCFGSAWAPGCDRFQSKACAARRMPESCCSRTLRGSRCRTDVTAGSIRDRSCRVGATAGTAQRRVSRAPKRWSLPVAAWIANAV